jgi:hypothetical protein
MVYKYVSLTHLLLSHRKKNIISPPCATIKNKTQLFVVPSHPLQLTTIQKSNKVGIQKIHFKKAKANK